MNFYFEEAIELALTAYNKVPTFLNAGYEASKYLCLNGQVDLAISFIDKILTADKFYSIKVIGDPDIMKEDKIVDYFENKKNDLNNSLKLVLTKLKSDSLSKPEQNIILDKLNELKNENTYLDARIAFDIINSKNSYSFKYFDFKDDIKTKLENKSVALWNSPMQGPMTSLTHYLCNIICQFGDELSQQLPRILKDPYPTDQWSLAKLESIPIREANVNETELDLVSYFETEKKYNLLTLKVFEDCNNSLDELYNLKNWLGLRKLTSSQLKSVEIIKNFITEKIKN